MANSIVENSWQFACDWYRVDEIHSAINRERKVSEVNPGSLPPVPEDVYSREFAEWMAEQYRLAMRKGAELAIREVERLRLQKHADFRARAKQMGIKEHDPIEGLMGG